MPPRIRSVAQSFLAHALNTNEAEVSGILHGQGHGHHAVGEAFVKELTQYAVDLQRRRSLNREPIPISLRRAFMSTFSPERVLTRPASGRPLWKEGWLAAALWLLGPVYLAWPDAGRRWPFSEGWAGAVHPWRRTVAAGAELPLLAAAGDPPAACRKVAGAAAAAFALWEGLTAKTAFCRCRFSRAAGAD